MLHDHRPESATLTVSMAEIVASLSHALDLTEGQPEGHCLRACWTGMAIGRAIGLSAAQLEELYYAILLKDLGCSSNAARVCELYEDDDRAFKQGYKTVGTSLAATIRFIAERTARSGGLVHRIGAVGHILKNGDRIAQELIVSRCTRGADIARLLGFSERIAEAIYHLDEHWDGSGRPEHRRGPAIPLFSQLALMGQVVDVFAQHAGFDAAIDEIARRSGKWFDPALCAAFARVADDANFWSAMMAKDLAIRLAVLVPLAATQPVNDDTLDRIAAAFGQVIDAKSPYTAGHSIRVAELTAALGSAMGVGADRARWLYRGGLLHDIGKLGVSNRILDKPGRLDEREWEEMRGHAAHTQAILGRVAALADIAPIAAAHHERIDGTGYPLGLAGSQIALETRIITACDFYDALTSDRPYRGAMAPDEALAVMEESAGSAVDPDCLAALRTAITG